MTVEHRAVTEHVRGRLKVAGIKAHCRMFASCGEQVIDIVPRGGVDARFTEAETRTVLTIADVNGLTYVRGLPIDIDRDVQTKSIGASFRLGYKKESTA